jgi:hypothetical protein
MSNPPPKKTKYNLSIETPVEVTLGALDLLKSICSEGFELLSKHLDIEAAKVKLHQNQLEAEVQAARKKEPPLRS